MENDKFDLIHHSSDILRMESKAWDFSSPPLDSKKLVDNMIEVMVAKKGLGLSAIQIGVPYKVFVIGSWTKPDSIFPVFNPRIVNFSDDVDNSDEGCLTFPGLSVKVKRPLNIRCRYQNISGDVITQTYSGITARVFQHEMDHCNGKLFFHDAGRVKLQMAIKHAKKLGFDYKISDLR